MATPITVVSTILILLVQPLYTDNAPCSIIDEWYNYLKSAFLKFGEPKMLPVNLGNMDFVIKGQDPTCYLKELFPQSGNQDCKFIRDNVVSEIMKVQNASQKLQPVLETMKQALDKFGIETDKACQELQEFNKKDESKKQKENYGDLFVKSVNYISYAFIESTLDPCHNFTTKLYECVKYTNDEVARTFGKTGLRQWSPRSCENSTREYFHIFLHITFT